MGAVNHRPSIPSLASSSKAAMLPFNFFFFFLESCKTTHTAFDRFTAPSCIPRFVWDLLVMMIRTLTHLASSAMRIRLQRYRSLREDWLID